MKESISKALAELREAIFEEMTKILRTRKGCRAELSNPCFIMADGVETFKAAYLDEDNYIMVVSEFFDNDGEVSEGEIPIALLTTDELLKVYDELDV